LALAEPGAGALTAPAARSSKLKKECLCGKMVGFCAYL
jgi:hypothetical protein